MNSAQMQEAVSNVARRNRIEQEKRQAQQQRDAAARAGRGKRTV